MLNVALRLVKGAEVDKEKALEAAISPDRAKLRQGLDHASRREREDDRGRSDLDGIPRTRIAFGIGGLPRGRIVEIYGPESLGKTTFALHVIAEAQKRGGICGFVDAEHAFDPVYARKLGVVSRTS